MEWAVARAVEHPLVPLIVALALLYVFRGADGAPTPTSSNSIAGWASTNSCARLIAASEAPARPPVRRSSKRAGDDLTAAPEDRLDALRGETGLLKR